MLLGHRPSAPLASHVEKLWYCDGQQVVPRIERIMPNARFQLGMRQLARRASGARSLSRWSSEYDRATAPQGIVVIAFDSVEQARAWSDFGRLSGDRADPAKRSKG
jgi:hypothetical protein